jgi:hypothetical protein
MCAGTWVEERFTTVEEKSDPYALSPTSDPDNQGIDGRRRGDVDACY